MAAASTRKMQMKPAVQRPDAPVVVVEAVPNFGTSHGVIYVTLATNTFQVTEGAIEVTPIVSAQLRLTRDMAMQLRDCLDSALLMGVPQGGPAN